MIRHVALFAWVPEATAQQQARVAVELRTLRPLLAGVRAYHIGPDAGLNDGNFDFAVVGDFDDTASYLSYRDHPAHRAIIEQIIAPITRQRVAVQYEL
jgi:Stress responsive A/B Barrel Domain